MQNKQQIQRQHRAGSALILAIITLLITTAICLSLTKTIALRHARHEQQLWKHQAQLLAQSALERAYQQLKQNPDYSGETWRVSFDSALLENGISLIKVETSENSNIRIVSILTHVPEDNIHRSQSNLTSNVTVP